MRNDGRRGGTIIAPNAVLTVASCLYDQQEKQWAYAKKIFILHGNFHTKNGWNLACHSCDRLIIHESYVPPDVYGRISPHDIAIIKLQTS